jgi:hypothetical protein
MLTRTQRIQKYINEGFIRYDDKTIFFYSNTSHKWIQDDQIVLDMIYGLSQAVLHEGDIRFHIIGNEENITNIVEQRFLTIIPKFQVILNYSGYRVRIVVTKEPIAVLVQPDEIDHVEENLEENKQEKKATKK